MKRSLFVATAALLSLPEVALAAEESHGGSWSVIWHAFNLLLIVGVIVYFGRSPIRAFMADRRRGIEDGIASAQQELDQAERRLADCNARIASLDREIEEIHRGVRQAAEAERDRLLADARAAADRIRRDALVAVEQEGRRARGMLRAEAAEMAVQLADDLLKRQIGDADRARLVDEFVSSIQTPAGRS